MRWEDLPDWNGARYDPACAAGHVESYFVKANSPDGSQAIWIKATIFAANARPDQAVAEAWAVFFERGGEPVVVKQTVPHSAAAFSRTGLSVQIAEHLRLDCGTVQGAIEFGDHKIAIDLAMAGDAPAIVLLPSPKLYVGAFPKLKLVTPRPDLVLQGKVWVDGREIDVQGWKGMQGHNWGQRHADFYAWGHCNQWDQGEGLVLEIASARVKLGPVLSPMATLVCMQHRGESYQLNGALEILRNYAVVGEQRWHFEAKKGGVRVEGDWNAPRLDFVGLYYPNPDGSMTYCLNTKLASARVRVEIGGRASLWKSRSAAFEVGTKDPGHGIRMYV